jgi:hypothetical protein
VVDDILPVRPAKVGVASRTIPRQHPTRLAFSQAVDRQIWVPLLEKVSLRISASDAPTHLHTTGFRIVLYVIYLDVL